MSETEALAEVEDFWDVFSGSWAKPCHLRIEVVLKSPLLTISLYRVVSPSFSSRVDERGFWIFGSNAFRSRRTWSLASGCIASFGFVTRSI